MSRSLLKVFQVYVFVYAFLFASRPMGDADFWFHLKTGQYVFTNGGVPRTEMWSFTYNGIPWVAHGWLSGVIFYAFWSTVGLKALIVVFALLVVVAFWIAFKRADSHPLFAGVAVLVGVWAAMPNIGVRPRVFTILFASIYLALLGRFVRGMSERGSLVPGGMREMLAPGGISEGSPLVPRRIDERGSLVPGGISERGLLVPRERWIWALVPLMVLWANLHGGFFIGFALIGLAAVGLVFDYLAGVLEAPETFRSRLRTLALVFVGCVLAGLVNPYGFKLYTAPLAVLRSSIYQDLVTDWLSPNFHLPTARPLMLLILLTTAVLALSPRRPKPSEVLLFLATLCATLKTQRNVVVFALVAVPLFATYFQVWLDSTSFGKSFGAGSNDSGVGPRDSNQALALLFGIALLAPLVVFAVRLKQTVYSTPTQQSLRVPVHAVDYLKQHSITGNTFAAPNVWGAYVFWSAPQNPVYIDGRDVYPDTFAKEFAEIIFGRLDWRDPFDRRGVQIVLVEPNSILARELGQASGWEKIYQDDMSVVFRRR